jgi:lipopolysaccharide export system protein LptC
MTLGRFPQLILFFIVCWSGYYLLVDSQSEVKQVTPDAELPIFTGRDVMNTTYNQSGVRNYRITSNYLDHYAKSGETIFENITLLIYREGDVVEWQVEADKGVLSDEQVLILSGDVIALNKLPNASFESLKTEKLEIELKSKDFKSDVQVTLLGPKFENIGQAMQGNLDSNNAVLYNQVHGIYETQTP